MKEGSGSDRGANMKEGSAWRQLAREFFDTQFDVGNILDGRKTDVNDPYSIRDPFYVLTFLQSVVLFVYKMERKVHFFLDIKM